jgi:N-acetylglucosaminyl-diphospho-decaprenol L-rhamnosyltransferase
MPGVSEIVVRPRVSVVIVSFRCPEYLERCLAALAACRDRIPLEVLVIDNASGDGTAEWLERAHPWVHGIPNPDNRGFSRGVNQGLSQALGESLLVLNPDCEVTAESLERLLVALETDPSLAAVAPVLLDGNGRVSRSCGRFPTLWTLVCDHLNLATRFPDSELFGGYKYGGRDMDSLDRVDWACGAALLIARSAYEAIGGLDERIFMYMDEVDWCRRANLAGRYVRFVPEAQFVHHGQRSARQLPRETYLHNLRSRVHYFRKHRGPPVAFLAQGILSLSLVLKWAVRLLPATRRDEARIYAAGLRAVWEGPAR